MAANCPRLRWVQGTSAGIGGFLERTGLARTPLVFTTAAGVHGTPLAEFALLGLLYFAKGMPTLERWQPAAALGAARRPPGGGQPGAAGRPGRRGPGRWPGCWTRPASRSPAPGRTERGRDVPGVDVLRGRRPDRRGAARDRRADPGLPADRPDPPPDRRPRTPADAARRRRGEHQPGPGHRRGRADQRAAQRAIWAAPAWTSSRPSRCRPTRRCGRWTNVIISPHSASTVAAENGLITDLFTDNLRRWLAGQPLRNVYDRAAGY